MYLEQIFERATKGSLFTKPLHLYTRMLFSAVSDMSRPFLNQELIKGEVPNPNDLPSGCLFHPRCPIKQVSKLTETLSRYMGRKPEVNQALFNSEMATNYRNRSLAFLYKSYNLFYSDVDEAIKHYTQACSLMVTTRELAIMGATLANDGFNPMTGIQAIDARFVRDILSVLLIYGLYDETGAGSTKLDCRGKAVLVEECSR